MQVDRPPSIKSYRAWKRELMIDLDASASMPLRPEAWEAMQPWLRGPAANPASAHALGRRARRAVDDAREEIASLLGAFPDEIVFTSGATESNNLAIFGQSGDPPGLVVSSRIEHPCVIEPIEELARRGFRTLWLPVSPEGILTPECLTAHAPTETRLVAVMLVNHETGAIQPVEALREALPEAAFHCDAAQAVGKIAVDFHRLGVSTLSLSGHKLGGPPGIGALLVHRCTRLRPILFGGPQQHGRRPGTEPVALIVGLAAALRSALHHLQIEREKITLWRQRLLDQLKRSAAPVFVNGPTAHHWPGILNLSFPGCRADALLMALDLEGICVSTGAACSSGSLRPSPVLRAMALPEDRLRSAIRLSLSPTLTETQLDQAAARIAQVVSRLRSLGDDEA
jgi:cysteine desulfurase